MKVIIAGSRSITDYATVERAMETCPFVNDIATVISGRAQGIDRLGEEWAYAQGIPVIQMPADWESHGKSAGPIRNRAMAKLADALVLIWDGSSAGSADMLRVMKKTGKPVHETILLEAHK